METCEWIDFDEGDALIAIFDAARGGLEVGSDLLTHFTVTRIQHGDRAILRQEALHRGGGRHGHTGLRRLLSQWLLRLWLCVRLWSTTPAF